MAIRAPDGANNEIFSGKIAIGYIHTSHRKPLGTPLGTTPTSPSMEWPLFTLVSLKSCFPPYIVGLLPTVFNYWQIFHFVIHLQL